MVVVPPFRDITAQARSMAEMLVLIYSNYNTTLRELVTSLAISVKYRYNTCKSIYLIL